MNWKKTAAIAVGILVLGVVVAVVLYANRPKAEKKKPPRMTPVVLARDIQSADRHVKVEVMGKVLPALEIDLKAQVAGEIVYADPEWIEGGALTKGQTALSLEDADYRIALDQAESELRLEMGRQDVARREWEMLGIKNPSDEDKALALRQPQLKSAQARADQAKLNLSRTKINAPFNAIVTAKYMNRGDQASPQQPLGTLVSTDSYHIRVSVPVDKLKWIDLPSDDSKGSDAIVHLPDGNTRKGRVIKLLADLEEKGRMARCLVEVKNPTEGEHPLLLNSFVKVVIEGKLINDIYEVHRSSFHEGGTVWLLTKDNRLKTMHADPLWGDRDHVFFQADIAEDDRIITSPLSMAIEDMELREAGDGTAAEETPKTEQAE